MHLSASRIRQNRSEERTVNKTNTTAQRLRRMMSDDVVVFVVAVGVRIVYLVEEGRMCRLVMILVGGGWEFGPFVKGVEKSKERVPYAS